MKSNFTFYGRHLEFTRAISVMLLFFSSFAFYSCNSSDEENVMKRSKIDNQREDNKVFTFHKNKNGKDNYWKAVFKEGRLTELYKNGEKIPDENVEDYTDMVNEELEDLPGGHDNYGKSSYNFNFDMRNLDSTLSHLGDTFEYQGITDDDSLFYGEQFHKDMGKLNREMKKLHKTKFSFHFDTAAFNRGMRELKKNLKHLKIHPHVYLHNDGCPGFDMEAFKEGMKNFGEEMKHNRIFNEDFKIDMREFENKMKNFGENMKDFRLNMKDLKKNMKKLNGFLKDLRHELVEDNLIKDEDENFSMKFNPNEMIINGNKVSPVLLEKYKGIYKKHYGKEIDDEINIHGEPDDEPDLNDK